MLQCSKKMVDLGITGPEGHEMCRPEWVRFDMLKKSHCCPCHPVMIQWSQCSIVFSLFWKCHYSPCHPVMIQWSECSIVFSLFRKSHCSPFIQSWSSDQIVPLSFHCFENLTVLHSSSHDPVIRIFHCLFIVLKISLFSIHPVMIQWSECSIVFSLFWKSHCSQCHLVMIQWSECSIVFSLFWKSHCSPFIQSWYSYRIACLNVENLHSQINFKHRFTCYFFQVEAEATLRAITIASQVSITKKTTQYL